MSALLAIILRVKVSLSPASAPSRFFVSAPWMAQQDFRRVSVLLVELKSIGPLVVVGILTLAG
jgi:hypothetical protein